MQTRTYGDLFKLIQSLAGVGSFAPTEADDVANLINRRFLQAFNESPIWPRYLVTSEERDIISLNISGLGAGTSSDRSSVSNGNYILAGQDNGSDGAVAGTNVYYNPATDSVLNDQDVTGATVLYKRASTNRWELEDGTDINFNSSLQIKVDAGAGSALLVEADSVKKDNPSEVVQWTLTATIVSGTPRVIDKQMIPYAQTGRDTIGSFNRIHRKKAFLNQSAIEYEFFVDFDGANILNITSTTDNSAFVTYKKQFTPFSVTGSTVADFTGSTVEVPAEFFAYLAHATYADFLRMDGQTDKAFAEENTASTALALELEKIDIISNNNTVNKRFSTYVNRQSR